VAFAIEPNALKAEFPRGGDVVKPTACDMNPVGPQHAGHFREAQRAAALNFGAALNFRAALLI
jgi:hypothetical protein